MVRAAAAIVVALALVGCEATVRTKTVTVHVPVEVGRTPPPELLDCALNLKAPTFVGSVDPRVSSCLTPEGERLLTGLVDRILTCNAGWRAWATAGDRPAP